MTSDPCNEYEQVTTSDLLISVLKYSIHKNSKGIECSRHCCDLYPNTSELSSSDFDGPNLNVIS